MKDLPKAIWSSVVEGADSKRVLALVLLLVGGGLCKRLGIDPPPWIVEIMQWAFPAWLLGESYASAKKNGAPPKPPPPVMVGG